jgi:hypothetical protein
MALSNPVEVVCPMRNSTGREPYRGFLVDRMGDLVDYQSWIPLERREFYEITHYDWVESEDAGHSVSIRGATELGRPKSEMSLARWVNGKDRFWPL